MELENALEWEQRGGKNYGDENMKATISNTNYDRSKTLGECGIFQKFG